ncbi:hypothetical protein WKW80_26910 [Variovorax humicola]|uniref:Lipoprotein n=1 Tax=Variovorax humicola TaxID=1769758 RepID=A0ABU8W6Q6_9BURK
MRLLTFSSLALVAVLAGCAPMQWQKPGSTQDEFSRARYDCLQQSQQRVSGAAVNQFGGTSSSNMQTNDGLYASCLNAKGFYLQRSQQANSGGQPGSTPASNPIIDAQKAATADAEAVCKSPEFQPLLVKSACNAKDLTFAQLAETSKMDATERAPFEKYKQLNRERTAKIQQVYRQYGGPKGAQFAALMDQTLARNDKNSLELYTGKINWGEYNVQRKADFQLGQQEWERVRAGG